MALLGPLPRLPSFDARNFARRLRERVTQPGGDPYAVFAYENADGEPVGLPAFAQGLRTQRDKLNETRVFANDVKRDLDAHKAADNKRHAELAGRVAALEAQPRPFLSDSG